VTDKILVSADTVRQRERTVDNVKRLYAFFLSLSFSNVFRELVERYDQPLKTYADAILQHPVAALQLALPPMLVFAIFFVTSSIFYFQADRLFDVRFALAEQDAATGEKLMAEWKPYAFFVEYISLILQMIPFALMSFAFTKRFPMRGVVTEFYFSYALLFIIPSAVTLCKRVGKFFRNEETTPTPITVHWLWINSLSLLAIGVGAPPPCRRRSRFRRRVRWGSACCSPSSRPSGTSMITAGSGSSSNSMARPPANPFGQMA
jgi:hypothetical protein